MKGGHCDGRPIQNTCLIQATVNNSYWCSTLENDPYIILYVNICSASIPELNDCHAALCSRWRESPWLNALTTTRKLWRRGWLPTTSRLNPWLSTMPSKGFTTLSTLPSRPEQSLPPSPRYSAGRQPRTKYSSCSNEPPLLCCEVIRLLCQNELWNLWWHVLVGYPTPTTPLGFKLRVVSRKLKIYIFFLIKNNKQCVAF